MRLRVRTKPGSWLSYSGTLRRTWRLTEGWRRGWFFVIGIPASALIVAVLWVAITLWYMVLVSVLGIFFPVLLPMWLIRRMDRARELREQREWEAVMGTPHRD